MRSTFQHYSVKEGLKIDESNIELLLLKGECLIIQDKFDQAFLLLYKALEIYPKNIDLLHTLSMLLYLQAKYDEALNWINQALVINPKKYNLLLSKGVCLRQLGQNKEAFNCLNTAFQINPGNMDRKLKADVVSLFKWFEKTIRWFDSQVDLFPTLLFFGLQQKKPFPVSQTQSSKKNFQLIQIVYIQKFEISLDQKFTRFQNYLLNQLQQFFQFKSLTFHQFQYLNIILILLFKNKLNIIIFDFEQSYVLLFFNIQNSFMPGGIFQITNQEEQIQTQGDNYIIQKQISQIIQ